MSNLFNFKPVPKPRFRIKWSNQELAKKSNLDNYVMLFPVNIHAEYIVYNWNKKSVFNHVWRNTQIGVEWQR